MQVEDVRPIIPLCEGESNILYLDRESGKITQLANARVRIGFSDLKAYALKLYLNTTPLKIG